MTTYMTVVPTSRTAILQRLLNLVAPDPQWAIVGVGWQPVG